MEKRWRIYPHESERIVQLERTASVSSVVAQLLIARGIEHPDAAKAFLDVRLNGLREPSLLPGAAEAADKVYAAVRSGQRIAVYGDYDADGVTATALLVQQALLLRIARSTIPNGVSRVVAFWKQRKRRAAR